MIVQRSIKSIAKATGVGVHSGQRVEMVLRPAPVNTGIVFRRVDFPHPVDIPVSTSAVTDTRMATTLSAKENNNVKVQTVEHLLSACAGLGVDNLYIDIDAEEVPILDGSASSYVYLLQSAGVAAQNQPRQFVRVLREVTVQQGEGNQFKWARLAPYEGYRLAFEIEFGHPAVDTTGQAFMFDVSTGNYARDIARARTFGFARDVEFLRARGLGLGGGLDNAIVMDDYKILNSGGLRYDDEFVKHKILDAMGDLHCLGRPLLAAYSAFRSGHALNNLLLRALLSQPDAYEIASFEDERVAPAGFSRLCPAW